MENQKNITLNKGIMIFFFLLLISAVVSNFNHYYLNKNYDYLITSSCVTQDDVCNNGECETNDRCSQETSRYNIKSYNYTKCSNGDCTDICNSDTRICQSI